MIKRDDIPLAYTCDANGNILTRKDSDGYWYEYTYDDHGNVLTYKNSYGVWREYTYDDHGNELTYKDSDGYWYEYTRDDHGNILTYKNSDGRWYEYARDDHGKMLTSKNSDGYWREYTRDDHGNILTYKHSDINNGELFTKIAGDDEYNLFTNEAKDYFVAGCRRFTKAEALGHWGNDLGDSSARAELFVKAIHELNNIKTGE